MPKRDLPDLFNELAVPFLKRAHIGTHSYRVYKNDEEFEVIEADTATEALEKSSFEHVHKVQLQTLAMGNIIKDSELTTEGNAAFEIPKHREIIPTHVTPNPKPTEQASPTPETPVETAPAASTEPSTDTGNDTPTDENPSLS